jgi:hypothetical protein
LIKKLEHEIIFAHTAFKWANLAANNAGVTVAIVGLGKNPKSTRKLYSISDEGETVSKEVPFINSYLVHGADIVINKSSAPVSGLCAMNLGNMPYDGGNLLLNRTELDELGLSTNQKKRFIKQIFGSREFINGIQRYCLWIENEFLNEAEQQPAIKRRIDNVRVMRLKSSDAGGRAMATRAHQLREMKVGLSHTLIMPRTSSESRYYLPAGIVGPGCIVSSEAFAIYDAPLWQLALLTSRLHLVWIATVCGQLETRYRYSNVLGWNNFPVPPLTDKNRADLEDSAKNILLARERYFPATIADLYDQATMPQDLRTAHELNDEILERIYIGRRFKNDTERLEKLFDLYTKIALKRVGIARKTQAEHH